MLHRPRHTESVLFFKLSGLRVLYAGHDSWAALDLQALRKNVDAKEIRRFRATLGRYDLDADAADV